MPNRIASKLTGMLALACLAGAIVASPGAGAADKELRIGFLAPLTGGFAQVGKDMVNGFQMYLDEVGGDFAGVKVNLVVEDEEGKPPVAVRKAEKLIRQDKVQLFVGALLASSGYALAPVSTRLKTVYVVSVSSADDLTQRDSAKFPLLVRTGWTSSQPSHPFGGWACEQGYKRIATIAADYAFGHEVVGGFHRSFESCGGRIVQKIWPPLGTIDFGPYLPTIRKDVDAIFTVMVGPMSLQFPKQLAAAGIKKPVLGGGTSYDEFVLPSMGDEVIGHVSALHYSAAIETPKNAAFVKAYRAKYGKVPSYYSETNYTSAQMIHEAMKRTKGKWPGAAEFVKVISAVRLEAVRGPMRLDEMRNPVHNIYVRVVKKQKMHGFDKDELWNAIVKTYPDVGQFYKYPKAEFLKQPVYSRDYPPCKYCE
ncbi:MAG: ABC transporter substrate-binding protein [Burkholderiales bacterium]|nr:ABC transporter substrate-binding protein [Burkholderiales bacterium]